MESMTGFGNSTKTVGPHNITVLAKSVNNKGLAIFFRMPREAAHLEHVLNAQARELFSRGRIDVSVTLESQEAKILPQPDTDLARAYLEGADRLAKEFYLTSCPDAFKLLTLPGMMRVPDLSESEDFETTMKTVCMEALTSLLESRREEGRVTGESFRAALKEIAVMSSPVAEAHRERVGRIFQDRKKRVADLVEDSALDENRMMQELALLSDRMDVTEEYQRLSSHIDAAMGILNENDCGRRLGFILQEMHRELNTMGSKVDETSAVHKVIEMKDLLGGLREQVANVQ